MDKTIKDIILGHQNRVRGIIKSITGAPNEDLEQEVYIKTWKNMHKYEERGKFTQWISTIAGNVSRDYLKSKNFSRQKLQENNEDKILNICDSANTPENTFMAAQRRKTIVNAINSLPAKYKSVVLLYDIEELSYDEISKKLKCPVGTVKSRLFNARKKLSVSLEKLI